MKIGRNQPCPCGSGKKYKKCCLASEQEERLKALQIARQTAPERDDADLDEEDLEAEEAPDPFWQEFESKDFAGRVAFFRQAVRQQPENLDGETARGMLSHIDDEAVRAGRFEILDGLVEELKACLPDLYQERASSYLRRRINNAFAAGRPEGVPDLANEFASLPDLDPDHFSHALDQMSYHGQLDALLEVRRLAWPTLRDSEGIMAWAVDAFAFEAINCILFDHCRRHPEPASSWTALHEELEFYGKMDRESVERAVACLSGHGARIWARQDFEWKPSSKRGRVRPSDQQELGYLTQEFLGDLHRRQGVSWTRGELGRFQLWLYLLKRFDGDLAPRKSLLESMMSPQKGSRPKASKPDHPLCPDPETLRIHLDDLLDFLAPQFYKAAALLELIPAWLRFLESRQLLAGAEKSEAFHALQPLFAEMIEYWESDAEDPAVASELKRSWADESG